MSCGAAGQAAKQLSEGLVDLDKKVMKVKKAAQADVRDLDRIHQKIQAALSGASINAPISNNSLGDSGDMGGDDD
jgi:hypothetical protein